MTYGSPTWFDAILSAITARLALTAGLPSDRIFASLVGDEDHLRFPPADRFLTISGLRFSVDRDGVVGGGRQETGFDGAIRIACFNRLATDQEFRSTNMLVDQSLSALVLLRKVIDGLQLYSPPTPDGSGCLLREPMRLESWDVKPMDARDGSAWAVLPTNWSVKFTMPLS